MRLLLENICNELTAPEKLVKLIQTLRYEDIGVCLDVGHAHLEPGVEAAIETLKPWIRSVHVHDNHGEKDEHLWPGEGNVDFQRAMRVAAHGAAGSGPGAGDRRRSRGQSRLRENSPRKDACMLENAGAVSRASGTAMPRSHAVVSGRVRQCASSKHRPETSSVMDVTRSPARKEYHEFN